MTKIILCGHTGSNNRGCEAIVRSTAQIMKKYRIGDPIYLSTFFVEEDEKLLNDSNIAKLLSYNILSRFTLDWFLNAVVTRLTKDYFYVQRVFQKRIWNELRSNSIALNIGGDVYCYGRNSRLISYALNRYCFRNDIPNVFWGCSIEKEELDEEMVLDLNRFSLIIVRESISYKNLINVGISSQKLRLYPDSAFTLPSEQLSLPDVFKGKVVGINLSPLVVEKGENAELIIENIEKLIEYILENSDNNIALIPHVYYDYSEGKQDVKALSHFYAKYANTGRVVLFKEDMNCKKIKYIISKCRFLVAARTHASIAGYSTCVPTLVIGYSVKSKGIAKDIFGTFEDYVVPVSEISDSNDILNSYRFIEKNEGKISIHLKKIMPDYIEKAWSSGAEIMNLLK